MVTALAPRRAAEPAGWIGRTCQDVSTLNGSLRRTDKEALIDSLRREDEPMHFPRSLDVMPGYIGVGLPVEMIPPKNVVRLNQVVKLSDTQTPQGARLGVSPPFSIRTAASPGAFALAIPVEHGDMLAGRCWLQLRLKVNAGRVGFAAYNNRIGILGRTPASILKGNEPVDVVLNMPSLRNTLYLVVFNDGDGPAEMEILDGSVLVSSQDWERNQATLAALR
jgi:hypothetical protein